MIELQGDHTKKIKESLIELGFKRENIKWKIQWKKKK
jgi:translation initiation factor 1 (eIF-1/SUI1)